MSKSRHKKERYGNHNEFSGDQTNEGTAARTRPFSIHEILIRRENKKQSGDVKEGPGGAEIALGKHVSDHLKSNKYRHDSTIKSNRRHASEDFVKVTSGKEEDKPSINEGKLLKDRSIGARDSETRPKATLNKNLYKEAKVDDIDRPVSGKRKHDEWLIDSEYENAKRNPRKLVGKDIYADRSRGKFERETKKEHQVEDDDRSRERKVEKKHDSGKHHDSEFSDRRERKEWSHVRREESRSKRRRSRSREHGKRRGRRSISVSPRSYKHVPYDVRPHGDSSSHPSKDKSRLDPDISRKRVSSNGSNSQYRKHGGSDSGLGGYSPRKRKTEAAVKTPPPTNRSPEKRSAAWDLPPADADIKAASSVLPNLPSSSQTISSNTHEFSNLVPIASIVGNPIFGSFPGAALSKINASIDSVQLTQATRPMRRLYIENLPPSATDKSVMGFLNNCLLNSGVNHIQGTQPCISCIIHKEKGQAIVEFLTPEDASAALSFDGRSFSGSVLKIRRPKDFVEVITGVPERLEAVDNSAVDTVKDYPVDSVINTVRDSPHKIFIGGIPKMISSKMLMEIASAFGTLRAYRFECVTDLSEQHAFLEYVDQSVTLKACAGLNGMSLGGQVLTAVQAIPDSSPVENYGNPPFYGIPEHAKPLLKKPTQVLKLKNLLNLETLASLSESDLEEILEDVRLECARFGAVKSINFVKDDSSITTEACEIFSNPDIVVEKQESNDKDKSMEILGEDMNGGLGNVDGSEHSLGSKELKENNKVAKTSNIHNGILREPSGSAKSQEAINIGLEGTSTSEDKVAISDTSSNAKDSEASKDAETNNTSDETKTDKKVEMCETAPSDGDKTIEDSTYCGNEATDTTQPACPKPENKALLTDEFKSENSSKSSDLDLKIETDALEKGKTKEQVSNAEAFFEPACILVEFRRITDSCIAAHCLHGRFFDDRIVAVEYVPYHIYRVAFGK